MNTPLLASIGSRFTAQFVDGLIALALGAATFFAAKYLEWPLGWMFVAFFLYMLLRDALPNGQSPGKRMTKIAVIHAATGRPCSWWRSVVRNISSVMGVFDVIPIVAPPRRRLGDWLAGTKVVQVRDRA